MWLAKLIINDIILTATIFWTQSKIKGSITLWAKDGVLNLFVKFAISYQLPALSILKKCSIFTTNSILQIEIAMTLKTLFWSEIILTTESAFISSTLKLLMIPVKIFQTTAIILKINIRIIFTRQTFIIWELQAIDITFNLFAFSFFFTIKTSIIATITIRQILIIPTCETLFV